MIRAIVDGTKYLALASKFLIVCYTQYSIFHFRIIDERGSSKITAGFFSLFSNKSAIMVLWNSIGVLVPTGVVIIA